MACISSELHASFPLEFHRISAASHGLSYDGTSALFCDSSGNVWMGTCNGLNLWDGRKIRAFSKEEIGTDNDYISSIAEDSSGNIWVGTNTGVFIYNRARDRFLPLSDLAPTSSSLPSNRIYSMCLDSSGIMWMSSRDEGLFSWDGNTLRNWREVRYIYQIVSIGDSLYLPSFAGKLYRKTGDEWTEMLPGTKVRCVCPADGGKLYLVTPEGVLLADISTENTEVVLDMGNISKAIVSPDGKGLWLAATDGLIHLDTSSPKQAVSYSRNSPSDRFSIPPGAIKDIVIGPKGILYAATERDGVAWCRSDEGPFVNIRMTTSCKSLDGTCISAFAEWKDGRCFVASERDGLFVFDRESGRLEEQPLPSDASRKLYSLAVSEDGIWCSSSSGMILLDPESFECRIWNKGTVFNSVSVARDGTVYAGSSRLCRYCPEKGFEPVNMPEGKNSIGWIEEDADGNIWMASYSQGVLRYDPSADSLSGVWNPYNGSPVPSLVASVLCDAAGNVWSIGFTSGIAVRSGQDDSFASISVKNSPLKTNVFYIAAEDSRGYIWLGSDSGIYRLQPSSRSLRLYSEEDGLAWTCFRKAGAVMKDGTVFFGTADGFTYFSPVRLDEEGVPLIKEDRHDLRRWLAAIIAVLLGCAVAVVGIFFFRRKDSAPSADELFASGLEEFVSAHLSETEFGIAEMENHYHCSRSTLTRRIKKVTGQTPVDYLRNRRLDAAAALLRDGDVLVKEVGYSVGFSSPAYFTRSFKARFGQTPQAWRNSARK